MRKKILLGLTLTTCLTAPAAAERWFGLHSDGNVIAYADGDSVSRNGGRVGVELFLSHNSGDYHKRTIEFDCPSQQYRIVSASDYGAEKTYIGTPEFETGWVAPTDTVENGLKGFACDGAGTETQFVSDPFTDAEDYWYYYYYDY